MGKKYKNITEEELVATLRDDPGKGIDILYENYSKALFNVIIQIVKEKDPAEEILHDAYVKIWKNFSSYDKSKGTLYTWMLNICRNLSIDKLRSREFKKGSQNQSIENSVNYDRAMATEFKPEHIGLKEVVDGLKPEFKEVLDLVYFHGYTQADASEELKIPLGTVKTRTRNAIIELRKLFK